MKTSLFVIINNLMMKIKLN